MSEQNLETEYSDPFAFYCFWKDQYMLREVGKRVEDDSFFYSAAKLVAAIANKSLLNHYWSNTFYKMSDFNTLYPLLGSDHESVTMRIPREIDETLLLNVFRMYKYSNHHNSTDRIGADMDESMKNYESRQVALEHACRVVVKLNSKARFKPWQWGSRALGIWLWDDVLEQGKGKKGDITDAIRRMKEQHMPEVKAFGFWGSEENVFRSFYRNTAKCIKACEVLSFK